MSKAPVFKDRVKIYVVAGHGGDGMASFRREKYVPRGGPDGGDGGHGGDVILRADSNSDSLLDLYYRPHQRAEHGRPGGGKKCHGRNGGDLYISVPRGVVVTDAETGERLGEVLAEGDELLVARGGKGGLGNCRFVTASKRAPTECTPGEEGERRTLLLELKTVADIGLVGYPNAGKSTLLTRLSNAAPRIAAYPFTTLNPVVGVLEFDDFKTLKMADIPGLIEGAHRGVGLGHDFLRHIERTLFLLYVIDMAGVDGREPWLDYQHLREEVRLYREELAGRPSAVVANKMDLPEAAGNLERFIRETGCEPLTLSALEGKGLEPLRDMLYSHFFSRVV